MTERASRPALGLVWDFDNRLRGADTNGSPATQEVTFEYDALGRRVARSEAGNNVVYVHAGQQVIADYARGAAAAAPSFRYVYGSYVDEPLLRHAGTGTTLPTSGTGALYYNRNQQYSIIGLSDAAGTLVERYAYTAYGELTILAPDRTLRPTSSFENRYTYTAREWDPTLRLYYFRARWLEPKAGRFIGREPINSLPFLIAIANSSSLFARPFAEVNPTGRAGIPLRFTATIQSESDWKNKSSIGSDHWEVTDLYCKAAAKYPGNGWLRCACDVSGLIDLAIRFIDFSVFWFKASESEAADKSKWFKCTRTCLQKRWHDAVEYSEERAKTPPDSAWKDFCEKCTLNSNSRSCCEEQVKAEQTELQRCFSSCGKWGYGQG
ncbi:MAG: RHS repeat domain-containing protein, partial [Planctomycetota bacterium]